MSYTYYFKIPYCQRTLSLSIAPQFKYLYQTSSVSVAPQLYHYNSTIKGDFDNCKPTIYGQQQQQKEQTVLGKRKLGEPKQEDNEVSKARKENDEEGPPRKKHWTLSKVCFRNPFILPTANNVGVAEQPRESKSRVEKQPVIFESIRVKNKRTSTIGTVKRPSLGPATNKAKVHKHNDRMAHNAKKAVKTAAKAAAKTAEEITKREEIKKRKEISRRIDKEALEIRKIKARQQQNLDNDIVARDKFIQAYAERLECVKRQRYENRIQQKLSPCHSCVVYNIYRDLC